MEKYGVPIPDISFHPPVYACVRAKKPFTLDGNVEKDFWEDAAFTDYFVDIEGDKREKPRFKTRVKMMWDQENLYVGAVLEGDEIWASLRERDSVIFQDNDFEIFIDPDSDTHQYFELEMNALGTVWDLFLTKPYRDFGASPMNGWEIHGLRKAVWIDGELNHPSADNRRWMAEAVLPFAALREGNGGKGPELGDYYRVNFSRVHWDTEVADGGYRKLPKPEHNWVWAPTGLINIHYPELWGFVFFTENGEEYPIPGDELLKWELRKVYYAQHAYFGRHKSYADTVEGLGLSDCSPPGFKMEITSHSFELGCASSDRLHRIGMFGDGKTWVYEHLTREGCLDFLYRFMPVSDIADYPRELFVKFVDHALMVRETALWRDQLCPQLFLNYVLPYRVNNEDIMYDRELFFEELAPRIQGMGMYEAALEVNYWCFEKAVYQSTDIRTASALTVIKNACGRCGEESGLAVAALRSVGLPARQCYTPRWAHCDDNHAWVEVWADGEWHFLGACEPEARLDAGWFRNSASKGMLIHNRVLTDRADGEVITKKTGHMIEINGLSRYADTKEVTVKVVDRDGLPVPGAKVRFEVVNFSEFYPLTTLAADGKGEARFLTGLGDLMVHAYEGESYVFGKMDVRTQAVLTLVLNGKQTEQPVAEYRFVPPAGRIEQEEPLTKEEEERHRFRMDQAATVRKAYEQTFFGEGEDAFWETVGLLEDSGVCLEGKRLFLENGDGQKASDQDVREAARFLRAGKGNHQEILAFLQDKETREGFHFKIRILESLKAKDLTDITAEVLKEHFLYAMPFGNQMEEELFCEAVLCPRIWIEPIRAYRMAVRSFFKKEELEAFWRDPPLLGEWIKEHITVCRDESYTNLSTSPEGLLRCKKGNEISCRILFVAVLRTVGIPAKLDPADLSAMYCQNGMWNHLFSEQEGSARNGVLILEKQPEEMLEYWKDYTVSFLSGGCYRTLDFRGTEWEGDQIRYEVPSGACRIVVSRRLPDGTNLVRVYHVVLKGEESRVKLELANARTDGRLLPLSDLGYETLQGEQASLYDDLPDGPGMVMWLAVGEEPTEHLLNELMEAKERYLQREPAMVLVVESREAMADPTLNKALKALPFIKVRAGYGPEALSNLYEGFGIAGRRLPLAVVTKGHTARFAWSGYHVGAGDLLLKSLD